MCPRILRSHVETLLMCVGMVVIERTVVASAWGWGSSVLHFEDVVGLLERSLRRDVSV